MYEVEYFIIKHEIYLKTLDIKNMISILIKDDKTGELKDWLLITNEILIIH